MYIVAIWGNGFVGMYDPDGEQLCNVPESMLCSAIQRIPSNQQIQLLYGEDATNYGTAKGQLTLEEYCNNIMSAVSDRMKGRN